MVGTTIHDLFVELGTELREVMRRIDRAAKGIALVVDGAQRLIATITDGDIRRAILAGVTLEEPVERLVERKRDSARYPAPISAPLGTSEAAGLALMQAHRIRQLPLVDPDGVVVALQMLDDRPIAERLPVQAVVMAGGLGSRLRPLTETTPKPMLPIAGQPLLEHIIRQLGSCGIERVAIATNYKKEHITAHFGSGEGFGVEIAYLNEEEPRGTAGALAQLEDSREPLLVINGDVLTRLDFRALLLHHRTQRAEVTVAVKDVALRVPYGVVEVDGARVSALREKPQLEVRVNAGIYLLEPTVVSSVPTDGRFDMTHLIDQLLAGGRRVSWFPIIEYWLDIGQPEDYEQAQLDHEERER